MTTTEVIKRSDILGRGTLGKVYLVQPRPADCNKYVMRRIRLSCHVSTNIKLQAVGRFEHFTKLHHPHLVHYEAVFLENGLTHICVVMERCENGSLYSHVMQDSEGPLPEYKIINWFYQIVAAVDFLHLKNLIHGDLRAKNVFLWPNEETCKVSDLRTISDEDMFEKCHISLDSAQHLPPEFWQCEERSNSKCFTAPADMFALGCLLHFLCCRQDTFEGPDFESISRKICNHVYSSPPAVYSPSISNLIDALLLMNCRKRLNSVKAMNVVKALFDLGTPFTEISQPAEHSSMSIATKMRRLRANLRNDYGYVAIQSKSCPAEYSVDWSTLANSQFPPHLFPFLHVALWQELVSGVGGVLPIPPILLPTELGVGEQGMPLVLVGHIQRDRDELLLAARLHDNVPDVIGSVKIRLRFFVNRKSRHRNDECEFTAEGVQFIKHTTSTSSIMVRLYGIPWEELCLKQPPRAQILLEYFPEATSWFEGLSPIFSSVITGDYPVIDWATLQGNRKWLFEWQRTVQNGDGVLILPPLCIPFTNCHGNFDVLYLVSHLRRDGTFLSYDAHIHPQLLSKEDDDEAVEAENTNLTACISLDLDISLKSNATIKLKCEKTVFPLERKSEENGMITRVWLFELTESDWESIDVKLMPKMTLTLHPLPLDAPFWVFGMAPVPYESPSWLELNWNKIEASVRWIFVWREILSPITGPSTLAGLITPSLDVSGDRHVICSLRREGENLILNCKNHESLFLLYLLPPMILFIDFCLYLPSENGTWTEINASARLVNLPNEMSKECELKLCRPEWNKLSTCELPRLRIRIIPSPK